MPEPDPDRTAGASQTPASDHDPGDALLPEPPTGYTPPERFGYSGPWIVVLATALILTSGVVFGGLLLVVQGPAVLESVFEVREDPTGVTFALRPATFGVAFVGTVVVVTVLHELVHGLVFGLLGYRVSYGLMPTMGAAYAAAFHQFQTRRDSLLVTLAPLVVLDVLLVPLLFAPVPLLAFAGFLGLVFNTAGAGGDLYVVGRTLRMPRDVLIYDSTVRDSYVFYPLDGESSEDS